LSSRAHGRIAAIEQRRIAAIEQRRIAAIA